MKENSRDSSLTERIKASAKLMEEQMTQFKQEKQIWEEEKKSLEQ